MCALAPHLSARVGNDIHTRPASLTASRVFPRATGLCLSQVVVHQKPPTWAGPTCCGWAPRHRHVDHIPRKPFIEVRDYLSSQGYREGRILMMPVGRARACWARVMDASHAHPPLRSADRVPAIWEGTELVRLSPLTWQNATRHIQTRSCAVLCNWRFQCLAGRAHRATNLMR